jgi:pyruvate ferredoxin oxidoreductase beta subunit
MEKKESKEPLFVSGHTACAGCGGAIAIRQIMKALGPDCIIVNPTSCAEIFSSKYPDSAWNVPYIHVNFENAASVAAGIAKALEVKGNDHTVVACIAGDGASYDIGFGALSGALERDDNVLYICYDNEAYMNTGIQRSGATPFGAWTTTSQVGKKIKGKMEWKKPLGDIVAAHSIQYMAVTSIAYPADVEMKVKKAAGMKGARFILVHSPCTTGWRYRPELTVRIARLAVETGLWKMYEVEEGKEKVSIQPKFTPVEEYLKLQKRFKHLTDETIVFIQKKVNEAWHKT